ncbi:MAG: DNA repair protein RadA [Acidobacteriota bacterium]
MRPATVFVCQACGAQSPKWLGRCPECGAWNSFVEERPTPARGPGGTAPAARSVGLGEVSPSPTERLGTGNPEVDRVLGGGLVAGGVVLLGGDPGVGKTTLVLQVLGHVARSATVLYATGEESLEQVAARARRLGVGAPGLRLLAETSVEAVLEEVERLSPKVLAVDSIQTSASGALASAPGSLSQVRECAARWIEAAKGRAMAALLVGHITKEGLIAGPKALEHMVDTVLYLEGERYRHLKALRAQKNRFGATSELALLEMTAGGLLPVENPSAALLKDRPRGVPGTVIGVAVQGTRPLLVEIQALTSPSAFGVAKRMSAGLDRNRVQLLSAVLERALRVTLGDKDLFVNVVGGVELEEPALDLPLCLAVASTYYGKPLPPDLAAFGEVGLAGEVRGVGSVGERVREASALGFTRGILPASDLERLEDPPAGGAWRGVRSLAEVADLLF